MHPSGAANQKAKLAREEVQLLMQVCELSHLFRVIAMYSLSISVISGKIIECFITSFKERERPDAT